MFRNLPRIETADELLDRSFKRARKKSVSDKIEFYRKKKTIIARTESFVKTIVNVLDSYIKQFPSINQLPMFYQELIKIKVDDDKLRKALGAVQWAKDTSFKIYQSQSKTFRYSKDIAFIDKKQLLVNYIRVQDICPCVSLNSLYENFPKFHLDHLR